MKKFILSFIMMLSLALLWNGGGKEVKAASNSYVCTSSIKVGNVKYSTKYVKDKKYPKQDNMLYEVCNLVQSKKGKKTKTIEKNVLTNFVSNKKVIYYSKIQDKTNTIYKYNLKTKKKSKVLSAKKVGVFGCSGKYLYYGKYNIGYQYSGMYADIYSCKLKNKKKTHMTKNIGWVKYYKGRVLLLGGKSDVDNSAVYLYKENGTKIKKLPSSLQATFKSDKVYCTTCKYNKNYEILYKVVCYSMNGKKEKTVVNWTKNYEKVAKYQ